LGGGPWEIKGHRALSEFACFSISWSTSLVFFIWLLLCVKFTCELRSSRCCCFRCLDRFADSRFDSILLLRMSSIRCTMSPSDPKLRVPWLDPDEAPPDRVILKRYLGLYLDLKAFLWLIKLLYVEAYNFQGYDTSMLYWWLGSYWEHIEPIEEHNGERENKMGASPERRVDHKSAAVTHLGEDLWHLHDVSLSWINWRKRLRQWAFFLRERNEQVDADAPGQKKRLAESLPGNPKICFQWKYILKNWWSDARENKAKNTWKVIQGRRIRKQGGQEILAS